MKLTEDTFKPYKDVLVDLLIDNLNDNILVEARSIGNTIRTMQGYVNTGRELPKDVEEKLSHFSVE